MAGMVVFEPDKIKITAGQLSVYESSPGIERGFCGSCGTTLSWRGRGLASLHIGTLDNPDGYPPVLHWRWEERSPWIEKSIELPHVEMEYPKA